MLETIYQALAQYGFSHPLHPIVAHLPVGLIAGGVIFAFFSFLFDRKTLAVSARHCRTLAFLMVFPAVLLGYADWQHFYGGAWLFEIKMKIMLTSLLVFLLMLQMFLGRKRHADVAIHFPLYLSCMLVVIGIGYFGGELVFGKNKLTNAFKSEAAGVHSALLRQGAELFTQRCAFCHYANKAESKVGPGLKDLFSQEKMSVSALPVSKETVEKQLRRPFKDMPSFDQLDDDQIAALLAYLETL
ncbi:MAG: cytochrome c [Desulfobacterales bacterium]|jgi:cytochrome c2|nr:cytochrome c [Desulfobacterales bacterium]